MRFALQMTGLVVGLPLEILIIAALRRGGYRRFPFIFLYTIVDLLTTLVELPPAFDYWRGLKPTGTSYASLYWIDETMMQVAVYLVVMGLLYRATTHLGSRRMVRGCLIAAAVMIALASLFTHYNSALHPGEWMTPWLRDLNFCSAILDLALWALLLASRQRDSQLLMLSGALGIQFTGGAIGASVQQLAIRSRSRPVSLVGSFVVMAANVFRLYIWWQALRVAPKDNTPN